MRYLVDSDVLIQAKNRHYDFAVCPGFWDWLDARHESGNVYSVGRVKEELRAGADELASWAVARDSFFLEPDDAVVESMRQLSEWATSRTPAYTEAAVTEFLGAADYYLVAQAHAHEFTVVTAEVPSDTVNKVKIPNACGGMNVQYLDIFTVLRNESAQFVLA